MAVINQLPRWAQLARRRGIREERNFSRTERFRRPARSLAASSFGPFSRRILIYSLRAHPNKPDPLTSRPQWRYLDQMNDRDGVQDHDEIGNT